MRVISQNRAYSVNFDNVIFWRQYEVIYAKTGNGDIVFGQYKSDERAAEVFEDMHNAYASASIVATGLDEVQIKYLINSQNVHGNAIRMDNTGAEATVYDNYVYWMPEE